MMNQTMIKRYALFLCGLLINAFGIALITKAGIGTSPISSVPYVLSLSFAHLSFGLWTFLINMGFIVIQMILLKKEFERIQWFQIIVNIVFSALIDLAMTLLVFLEPSRLISKIVCLVAGCAFLGFGVSLEVAPQVIMVPGEGIVHAMTKVTNKSFATIKNCFDLSLMLISGILSIVCFGSFQGVGAGTIMAAVLVGRFVALSKKSGIVQYASSLS
ncbi:hypothetical protein C815_01607 [Firmicutes bacterium M10-2]|nr:hypothetical protein C815_01607 [Firmicutes bacterium M10-2]